MLKNQTQLNQKDLLVLESQAPPPPGSRFDQQFLPGRQSQLAQPGVVVPQTIYVPNHPPPVVSMVSHPPPPQMGIHFWRFLPPWQLFRTFKKHFGFFS